jgi:hypothetical protein
LKNQWLQLRFTGIPRKALLIGQKADNLTELLHRFPHCLKATDMTTLQSELLTLTLKKP